MGKVRVEPLPYPEPKGLLKGKTVLITAAAGTGIGFATAKRCAEEGARIFVSTKSAASYTAGAVM